MKVHDIKMLAEIAAIKAEIEAMKIANTLRERNGHAPAYGEDDFMKAAEELRVIAAHGKP